MKTWFVTYRWRNEEGIGWGRCLYHIGKKEFNIAEFETMIKDKNNFESCLVVFITDVTDKNVVIDTNELLEYK